MNGPPAGHFRVLRVTARHFATRTRFPFRFGHSAMTEAPHVVLRAELEIAGQSVSGWTSEGLVPKWFTKDPQTDFITRDLPDMLAVIRHAMETAASESPADFFAWWWNLVHRHQDWGRARGIPPLLNQLGTTLVERAVLDGLARGLATPAWRLIHDNRLGLDLGRIDPELKGCQPREVLPREPRPFITARHTVGMGDALTESDLDPAERVDDGLPQTLEDCIRAYGLRHFKLKLGGDPDRDRKRLADIARVLERAAIPNLRVTLDGNEQYASVAAFREAYREFLDEPACRRLLQHLDFVEQPVHRDRALTEDVRPAIAAWTGAPPLIIDESDAEFSSFPRARELGYAGTSHKNCKGLVKGLVNAARRHRWREQSPHRPCLLSGEDLSNIGPLALHQDLAFQALLGIDSVERNGHHYFAGLDAFPESVAEHALRHLPGLYTRDPGGRVRLDIRHGRLDLRDLHPRAFGDPGLNPDTWPASPIPA